MTKKKRVTKAELEQQLRESEEGRLRALAECENMRARQQVNLKRDISAAEARLLHKILRLVDDIDRAASQGPDVDPAVVNAGVALIRKEAHELLKSEGVEAYQTMGKKFEPKLMEAIAALSTNALPPGDVAEQLTCGYTRHGEVLRPAQVMVAQPQEGEHDDG